MPDQARPAVPWRPRLTSGDTWLAPETGDGDSHDTSEISDLITLSYAGQEAHDVEIHFTVDGSEFVVQVDESGQWEFESPELANGSHQFELWSVDPSGRRSDSWSWEANLYVYPEHREELRERVGGSGNTGTSASSTGGADGLKSNPEEEKPNTLGSLLTPWGWIGGLILVATFGGFLMFGGGGGSSSSSGSPSGDSSSPSGPSSSGSSGSSAGIAATAGPTACELRRDEQLILDFSSPDIQPTISDEYFKSAGYPDGFPTPPFEWSTVPPETTEIAVLIMDLSRKNPSDLEDPMLWWNDLPNGSLRWVLSGIDPSWTSLPRTSLDAGLPPNTVEESVTGMRVRVNGESVNNKFVGPDISGRLFMFAVFALCDRQAAPRDAYREGGLRRDSIAIGWFVAEARRSE
jgi:hypothetical protein